MKIDSGEFVTFVTGAESVSELLGSMESLGSPCVLIVKTDASFSADAAFPADIPFITAIAADEGQLPEKAGDVFDILLTSEEAEGYAEKLFKDKTKFQADQITACFIAARQGKDVLGCASRAFYRLMEVKNNSAEGGSTNE